MEGYVEINGHNVSIALLQAEPDAPWLPSQLGLSMDEYVEQLERWATGAGLPYGVGRPRTYHCEQCGFERRSTMRDELDPRVGGYYCSGVEVGHPPVVMTPVESPAPR